jgi:hypothetical protein
VAGAGAGAVCAIAPLASAETARASVVFLNVFMYVPFWLNKKNALHVYKCNKCASTINIQFNQLVK